MHISFTFHADNVFMFHNGNNMFAFINNIHLSQDMRFEYVEFSFYYIYLSADHIFTSVRCLQFGNSCLIIL